MIDLVARERPRPVESRATDLMTWDATHLRVRDLDQALGFWRDLLGLEVTHTSTATASLGVEDAELIVLHDGARRPSQRGHSGLYHVALHLPSAKDFVDMLARLVSRGVDPRPTDHLMHWAMYLSDGDGIGVELSFETADRFDHIVPGGRMSAVGTDGRQHRLVEALDLDPITEAFPSPDTDRPMPAGTRVGHNHLHVGDLDAATAFYAQLGFEPNPSMMGMTDFRAHGTFPHRLAINEWQGPGASVMPADAAGLQHLRLTYAETTVLEQTLARLDRSGVVVRRHDDGATFSLTDPSGNPIQLTAAAG